MTDLEKLEAIAKQEALAEIVAEAEANRIVMEAHIAALKQQAAYAANSAEYQAQIERNRQQCHQ